MTIETNLERIASALEKLVATQTSALGTLEQEYAVAAAPAAAPSAPPPGPPVTPGAPSSSSGTTPAAPAPGALPPFDALGAPAGALPQTPFNAPGAPFAGAPMPGAAAPAPSPTPVQGVPTLDDIRAAFNDFSRAHQDRIQEAYAIVLKHEAKSLDQLKPATYPQVMQELKALGG